MRILKRNGLKLAVGLSKLLSFITLSLMAVLAVEFWILTGKEYSSQVWTSVMTNKQSHGMDFYIHYIPSKDRLLKSKDVFLDFHQASENRHFILCTSNLEEVHHCSWSCWELHVFSRFPEETLSAKVGNGRRTESKRHNGWTCTDIVFILLCLPNQLLKLFSS